jgi:putative exporter of polyketide antibiotics
VREEEEGGRLEILFPRPVGRTRWLVAALYGSALLAVAIGLFACAGAALIHADVSVWSMAEASLNCLPLTVLFVGLGTLLYGFRPGVAIATT